MFTVCRWLLKHPILTTLFVLLLGCPLTFVFLLHQDRAAWEAQKAAWAAAGTPVDWSAVQAAIPADRDEAKQAQWEQLLDTMDASFGNVDAMPTEEYLLECQVDSHPEATALLTSAELKKDIGKITDLLAGHHLYLGASGRLRGALLDQPASGVAASALPVANLLQIRRLAGWMACSSRSNQSLLKCLLDLEASCRSPLVLIEAMIHTAIMRETDAAYLAAAMDNRLPTADLHNWQGRRHTAEQYSARACEMECLVWYVPMYEDYIGRTLFLERLFASSLSNRGNLLSACIESVFYDWRQSQDAITIIERSRAAAESLRNGTGISAPIPPHGFLGRILYPNFDELAFSTITQSTRREMYLAAADLCLRLHRGEALPGEDQTATQLSGYGTPTHGVGICYERLGERHFRLTMMPLSSCNPVFAKRLNDPASCYIGRASRLNSQSGRRRGQPKQATENQEQASTATRFWNNQYALEIRLP